MAALTHSLRSQINTLEGSVDTLRWGKVQAEWTLGESKRSFDTLFIDMSHARNQLLLEVTALGMTNGSLEARLVEAQKASGHLKGRVLALEGEEGRLGARLAEVQQAKWVQMGRVEELEGEKDDLEGRLADAQQACGVQRGQVRGLEGEKGRLRAQLAEAEEANARLAHRVATVHHEKDVAEEECKQLRDSLKQHEEADVASQLKVTDVTVVPHDMCTYSVCAGCQ